MADVEEINRRKKQEKEDKKREQEELLRRKREEEEKLHKRKIARQKRRLIPAVVMLLAGAIVSLTMLLLQYELNRMLKILLVVLFVFYIVGELIKWMFDTFATENEEKEDAEGEVIEKQQVETDDHEQQPE